MRNSAPHPGFVVCLVLAGVGLIYAVVLSLKATHCKPLDDLAPKDCGAGQQVQVESALVFGVCSVALAVAAFAFQSSQTPAPGEPRRVPIPPPAAPPYPPRG